MFQCKTNCTGLRKIEPIQNHIKPELQHIYIHLLNFKSLVLAKSSKGFKHSDVEPVAGFSECFETVTPKK